MTETQTSRRRKPERTGALVRPGLAAPALPAVELDPRPIYDFLLSACYECGEPDELLPEDRTWMKDGRAALTELLGPGCASCTAFGTELGRLFIRRPDIKTARDVVAAVDALNDRELLDVLMGELVESPETGEFARRALDGDQAAFRELYEQLEAYKGHPVLPESLSEIVPAARAVVHAWLPRFQPIEARVVRMIERDVDSRDQAEIATDPLGFVEKTTAGVRLVPEPSIKRIVLAPTYFGRPFNSLTKSGDTQLVVYPIADSALGAAGLDKPTAATVRLYRALGDETRLRILHLLAERDRYLTELATELELSKPTISHHLAQLRSAGLVTTTDQGTMTYYSLRRDRVQQAGPELASFLAH
jgi:DNA-binding transcriptional ArsR family regulator